MSVKVENSEGGKFFAVKKVLKIGGRKHIPSVCYPITEDITGTISGLVTDGLATIFDEKVRFISGRAVAAGSHSEAEEPKIIYLPPTLKVVEVPETDSAQNGNDGNDNKAVDKNKKKSTSSVPAGGKGEFAEQTLS